MPAKAALAAFVLLLALALAPAASATPSSSTTAAVSLGDSYISGEAGRWAGNSIDSAGDKDGTDRACQPAGPTCQVDKTRVYEPGTENGACHRSDVAEIKSAKLAVDERIDLSCSGAVTKNLFRASQGGEGQNGEPAQADKLLPVAKAKDVKLIMLSIGGNDLGFASIIGACLQAYEAKTGPCEPSQQIKIDKAKPAAIAGVAKAIDEIRAVMAEAGYAAGDYRLILQTYPSVAPRAAENRYAEQSPERTANGCPLYDQDSDWARDRAAPQIGAVARAAANARGVETLDLIDAFQGHEFCSKSDAQNTALARPAPSGAEWGRFLSGSAIQQGELQEVFHPNAYGQMAIGACVTQAFAAPAGSFACAGAAGREPGGLALRQLSTFTSSGAGAGGGAGQGATGSVATCLPRLFYVSAQGIGRVRLGATRRQLDGAAGLAGVRTSRSSTSYRYCVAGGTGRVTAVFGPGSAVDLVASTAAARGFGKVRPGVGLRTARRAYPRLRRVSSGLYRLGPRSRRVVIVRSGRVRSVGVASARALRSQRLLRTYARRVG
jgi:lysophospholipase L1-like esterase